MEQLYGDRRLQRRLLFWAVLANLLFWIAVVHNTFFYKHDHVAAHNFGYNMSFYIPFTFSAALMSFFVATTVVVKWRKLNDLKSKLITLSLTLPILILVVVSLVRMFVRISALMGKMDN
jgi:hypothetical protein